jgi:transitional endoplasmic reticulum ATPase
VRFGIPDAAARRAILSVHLRGRALREDIDLDALVAATEGASGADLATLVDDAARGALARALAAGMTGVDGLGTEDLDAALGRMHAAHAVRQDDFIAPNAEAGE